MTETRDPGLTYYGALLRRDAVSVLLQPADGAEVVIGIADIARIEEATGPHGARFAMVEVVPGAMVRAVFRAGAACLEPNAPGPLPLIAYERDGAGEVSIIPGDLERDWMNETPARFAYRCLPLLIANQSGWMILNTHRFAATWNGGIGQDSITVEHFDFGPGMVHYALSHFGSGVLTFSIPYLFRTPPGYNLHVRGPANMPKDGIAALEGIVETDWSDATFTMNWKFTRPNHRVLFEEDEPIAMISPIRRGEVERFRPVFRALETDKDTEAGFIAFTKSRADFIKGIQTMDPDTVRAGWQRHYMRGETAAGKRSQEHQTSVSLARFIEEQIAREEGE
jgi:hypothetical protein